MQAGIRASGSSDAALGQDLSSVDAEMTSLNSDSANINAGLNDKPINQ